LCNEGGVEVDEGMKDSPIDMNLLEFSRCTNVKEERLRLSLPRKARRNGLKWGRDAARCVRHTRFLYERVDALGVYLYYYIVIWQ
jgi:hypothetical protein